MVRHILKKDWLLLWPLVGALTALQALIAWARFTAGPPPNSVPSVPAAFLVLLAASMLIALVVHQDPIPGTRQDWLTRPIGRGDLFLSKLLFVIALVQGPWFVADVAQGVAGGFGLGQSVTAAAACAGWVLLTLTIPMLAFAAVTASMTETLAAAIAVLAMLIVPALIGATSPTALTGFAWVPALVRELLLLGAAIGVLILQDPPATHVGGARAVCRSAARRHGRQVSAVADGIRIGPAAHRECRGCAAGRGRLRAGAWTCSAGARPGPGRRPGEAGFWRRGCRRGESAAPRRRHAHGVSAASHLRSDADLAAAGRSLGGDAGRPRRSSFVSRHRQQFGAARDWCRGNRPSRDSRPRRTLRPGESRSGRRAARILVHGVPGQRAPTRCRRATASSGCRASACVRPA